MCRVRTIIIYFKIGSKDYEKIINEVLKNVNENLRNKEKDINKILGGINETLEEIIKILK